MIDWVAIARSPKLRKVVPQRKICDTNSKTVRGTERGRHSDDRNALLR